jgi:hypothetical protein
MPGDRHLSPLVGTRLSPNRISEGEGISTHGCLKHEPCPTVLAFFCTKAFGHGAEGESSADYLAQVRKISVYDSGATQGMSGPMLLSPLTMVLFVACCRLLSRCVGRSSGSMHGHHVRAHGLLIGHEFG